MCTVGISMCITKGLSENSYSTTLHFELSPSTSPNVTQDLMTAERMENDHNMENNNKFDKLSRRDRARFI